MKRLTILTFASCLVVLGGSGRIEIARSTGRNWARADLYKDRCDGPFISPIPHRPLQARDTCGCLAADIEPDAIILTLKSPVSIALRPKPNAPYLRNARPKKGCHTFYAVATDPSPERNRTKSFSRTICVP
jgi:hypothetical protein